MQARGGKVLVPPLFFPTRTQYIPLPILHLFGPGKWIILLWFDDTNLLFIYIYITSTTTEMTPYTLWETKDISANVRRVLLSWIPNPVISDMILSYSRLFQLKIYLILHFRPLYVLWSVLNRLDWGRISPDHLSDPSSLWAVRSANFCAHHFRWLEPGAQMRLLDLNSPWSSKGSPICVFRNGRWRKTKSLSHQDIQRLNRIKRRSKVNMLKI
jgi:hypothetical protein